MTGLFTVLIAEKHYIDAIRLENKLFFEPFLANRDLAFCSWNPEGQSLNDSVPELVETVGRTKEWRAIILNSCSHDQVKQKNPFDTVDFSGVSSLEIPNINPEVGQNWDDWEQSWRKYYDDLANIKGEIYKNAINMPLQRLATYLSFKPTGFVLENDEDHFEKDAIYTDANTNPAVRLERLEREQYRHELKTKEKLRVDFVEDAEYNISYPKEILCISERISDGGFFSPEIYWNTRVNDEYSQFCDRNMYFDNMRFMVFDLLPKTHKDFRRDKIRFLSTVLVFASNQTPVSTLQPRRLYVLESGHDDEPLCTLVTSYDKKLSETYDMLENEIDKIYGEIPSDLSDKDAQALFCSPIDIEVNLDSSCDTDSLFPDHDYGLFSDSPTEEMAKWKEDLDISKKSYEYIIRQQRRSVKKGVDRLNLGSEFPEANISRLTKFQLDDIKEYTENAENDMVNTLPPDLEKSVQYPEQLKEKSDAVEEVMKRRMTKMTALIMSGVFVLLVAILFIPFISANSSSVQYASTATTLVFVMIGLLVAALIVCLFVLRIPLVNAVKNFNASMQEVVSSINNAMRRYSKYFGLSCNVRRGYKILLYSSENIDEYTKSIRIRKKHQENIKRKRAELEENYSEFIRDHSYCDQSMIQPYDYDFDRQTQYSYQPPFLSGFAKQIDFIEVGNKITVPSGYITGIEVRMEEIYDS